MQIFVSLLLRRKLLMHERRKQQWTNIGNTKSTDDVPVHCSHSADQFPYRLILLFTFCEHRISICPSEVNEYEYNVGFYWKCKWNQIFWNRVRLSFINSNWHIYSQFCAHFKKKKLAWIVVLWVQLGITSVVASISAHIMLKSSQLINNKRTDLRSW